MAHRIVPKISLLPYRVQGVQSATTRLRLLEVSSFHSGQASVTVAHEKATPMSQPSGAVALHRQPRITLAFR